MSDATPRQLAGTPFVEQGQGEPVLLVHGAVCDHRIWEAQRAAIASRYRYIAVDLRYHGTAPWPDEGRSYSVPAHAEQLAGFLQALDAGPVHLLGQSYGAHVATRLALDQPRLLRTLVLQEPAIQSLLEGPEAEAILAQRQQAFAPAVVAIRQGRLVEGAQLLVEALINQGPGTFDAAPEPLKAMVRDNARTLPLLFTSPPAPAITRAQLAQLQVPTLVINGEGTTRFFSAIGESVAASVPGARRQVIRDASHGVETQNPEAYWRVLHEFLAAPPAYR